MAEFISKQLSAIVTFIESCTLSVKMLSIKDSLLSLWLPVVSKQRVHRGHIFAHIQSHVIIVGLCGVPRRELNCSSEDATLEINIHRKGSRQLWKQQRHTATL